MNGDGFNDFIVRDSYGEILWYPHQSGLDKKTGEVLLRTTSRSHMGICDFNNDSLYDIITYQYPVLKGYLNIGTHSSPLFNQESEDFIDTITVSDSANGNDIEFTTGDINNDGITDLLIRESITSQSSTYWGTGKLIPFYGDSENIFSFVEGKPLLGAEDGSYHKALNPAIGDLNGDGLNDILFSGLTEGLGQITRKRQFLVALGKKEVSIENITAFEKSFTPVVKVLNNRIQVSTNGKESFSLYSLTGKRVSPGFEISAQQAVSKKLTSGMYVLEVHFGLENRMIKIVIP